MSEDSIPVAYKGDEPYIFVSYAHNDESIVLPIIKEMQNKGYRVCYDKVNDLRPWAEVVTDYINRCSCFIAFISNNYFDSSRNYCTGELLYAAERCETDLLVFLDDIKVPDKIYIRVNWMTRTYAFPHKDNIKLFYDELFQKLESVTCCKQNKGTDIKNDKADKEEESIELEGTVEEAKTVQDYLEAAEQGDPEAQYNLAECYYLGKGGVDRNDKEAVEWFKKAAVQGNPAAQSRLGYYYKEGRVIPQDIEKAVELFKSAADQGDDYGQCNLGYCYALGEGVERNDEKELKYYREAAEQGNVIAIMALDDCYENGVGLPQDPEGADKWYKDMADWYEKEAEQGRSYAQHIIGDCYSKGIGRKSNPVTAFWWYKQAAEQGDAEAQYYVGEYYSVDEDDYNANIWYRKAAENGHVAAQYNIGMACLKDAWETPPYAYWGDKGLFNEAIEWFKKVDSQKKVDENIRADAQTKLGECYEYGLGVDINNQEAIQWYTKAVKQGNAEAQYHLGKCYEKGCGGILDYKAAANLYKKAAKQGYTDAQYKLGKCYESGRGVKEDHENAFKLYKEVADDVEFNANTAGFDCFEYASVFIDLGRCYEYGLGVHKSFLKADDCYRKAIYYGAEGDDYDYAQQHMDDFRIKDLI